MTSEGDVTCQKLEGHIGHISGYATSGNSAATGLTMTMTACTVIVNGHEFTDVWKLCVDNDGWLSINDGINQQLYYECITVVGDVETIYCFLSAAEIKVKGFCKDVTTQTGSVVFSVAHGRDPAGEEVDRVP